MSIVPESKNGVPMTSQTSILKKRTLSQVLAEREAELAIINSVQLALASRLDVQSIYNLVGDKIRDIFDSQVVMISTYNPQDETIEHRYAIERGEHIIAPGRHPIRGFRTQIVQTKQPVLVNHNVPELAARLGQPTIPGTITPKSWLGVPMMVGDQVTGILSLQHVDRENAFDESHVRLLQTLAASMSVALENARLWEQEELYRKALEREFEIGREIQASFLPESLPQPGGWEIAALLKSAREVSGDFYDVFELAEGQIGLVIADVCDKGLGAALFMTLFRTLLRAVSNIDFFTNAEYAGKLSMEMRLKNAMSLTNNYVVKTHGNTSMFCSIFFGLLDPQTGKLTYVNGGHPPPRVIDHQGIKQILQVTGPAVGLAPGSEYSVREVEFEKGDILFAHTDGLTDTINSIGESFSDSELIPLLVGTERLSITLEKILDQITAYSSSVKQIDDITMLAVRRMET
jgi:serine phosphatase RsbU (regulator of sigma subunit)